MKRPIEEALVRCLARLEEGSTVEEALRGQEAMAAELRPLLEAAYKLRTQANRIEEYRPYALERGRSRMHAVRASRVASARAPFAGLISWRPVGLAALAVVVALLAVLGSTTGIFHFGAGTTSAYLEGVVSRADPNAIVLNTADGQVTIRIAEGTVVLDADGNVVGGGDIVPGRLAKVEVEEGGTYLARRIEMEHDDHGRGHGDTEVEFSGTIQTVGASTLTVQASFGVATVHFDSQTEVKGALSPGGVIDIHATLQEDGSYLAREIDVGDEDGGPGGGENGGDRGDDGSGMGDQGSGSGDDSMNDGSGMGDQGSGDGGDSMNDGSGMGDQGSGDSGQSHTDDHMDSHSGGSGGDSMGSP
jgi:hypothetical protein